MRHVSLKNQRKAWLYAVLTSALLLQAPGVSFAEEAQEFLLDQVVVTANRVATPVAKAAANVAVITREEIAKRNYASVGEALRDVNGVTVGGMAFAGATQTVRLNGDDRVLVMIDGRRIGRPEGSASGRASVDFKSIISMDNIERIEIVKGGASSLYGSDAVGGVINIITRKGSVNKTTLDLATGSWGERKYALTTQGSENGFSWFLSADRKAQDYAKYNVINPALTPGSSKGDSRKWVNSAFEGQGLTLRLDKQMDDNSSWTFNFEHWSDKDGQPYSLNPTLSDIATHLTNNWALTYNFNQKAEIPGFARVYANYSSQGIQGSYKSRTQGFQYQTGWALDASNKLVAGVDGEKAEALESIYNDGYLNTVNYKDKSVSNTAIYLQDVYSLTDKWTVTPGLRYDHHSRFGGQTSPKININYSADSTTDLYVSFNRVFKAPTLDDLYYNIPAYLMYGDPNLKPEKGHVVTAGINKKLSDATSVKANVFTSEITDAIDWVAGSDGSYRVKNLEEQRKRGFELDVHHKLSDTYYAELGYSYVKIENKSGSADYTIDPENSQPNGYRVKVGYGDAKWDAYVNGQNASGRNSTLFGDRNYWLWNMSVNYHLSNDTTIYVNGYNLSDEPYQLVPSTTTGNYPMAARNFQMGVKYSF